MRKVGIYGQFYHANSELYIEELLNVLDRKDVEVCIEKEFLQLIDENKSIEKEFTQFSTFQELDESFDLFISVGGDGTILKSVNFIRDLDIPIVGINTGRLGFLATVNKEEIRSTIERILNNEYSISERSLLCIKTEPEEKDLCDNNFALNEIAVSRKNTTSMITIETWLDDEYLTAYWADGLIVSTPTGSTGYSLSCGGPVITPSTKALAITPIAPHNLNARPLIIKDNTKIVLKVSGREDDYLVSMDSRIASLKNNTTVIIEKAPFKIKMIEFTGDTFLRTLRKKLLWGEDRRN
ncbi:NAD+ kinase [Salinimicrobium catena]|uniref:NAD kinase n=1 Tax=Salinimicrobium catena TaxID=390640 RepID=A0A1H5H3G4_9FLAO|nr:NAD kinase [Salinimicrobium catena]SDK67357.1 NAD+ kinase [Salinimicrobium catena]SEE22251.1 NAD+ kinase [Salinimicrobium catena]